MLHGYRHSFIINVETEDFCEDFASDVEKRFDMSNCDVKKIIGLINAR